jgi:hypothetical protein
MSETHNRYADQPVIVLKWRIGQRVHIAGADADGYVVSANVSRDGIEYCVRWFNDAGTRSADWFQAPELTAA